MSTGHSGDDPVSAAPDLVDEPALAWRGDLPTRQRVVADRWRQVGSTRQWTACAVAAVVAGPLAILGAVIGNATGGAPALVAVVVIVPLVEESVKAGAALWLAESRPWLVPRGWALVAVAATSGLVFAAVENWWYLQVLIERPSATVIRWRWIAGPILHGVASTIAGLGAVRVWRVAMAGERVTSYEYAHPFIIAAAAVHGLYNGAAVWLERAGVIS